MIGLLVAVLESITGMAKGQERKGAVENDAKGNDVNAEMEREQGKDEAKGSASRT